MKLLLNIDVPEIATAEAFYTAAFGLQPGRRFGADGLELLGLETPLYLLAALDRRRSQSAEVAATSDAALKRAEAQLSGILAERLSEALREPSRAAQRERVLRGLGAHEIDPYSAADRLLAILDGSAASERR